MKNRQEDESTLVEFLKGIIVVGAAVSGHLALLVLFYMPFLEDCSSMWPWAVGLSVLSIVLHVVAWKANCGRVVLGFSMDVDLNLD